MRTEIFYKVKKEKEKIWEKTRRQNKNANWSKLHGIFVEMYAKSEWSTEKYPDEKMYINKLAIEDLIDICSKQY